MTSLEFYKRKRVLVTGHTGFKGAWLCQVLADAGAVVTGYALAPEDDLNLFSLIGLKDRMVSEYGDIRNLKRLSEVFQIARPEVVFHLAAQPIVRTAYEKPVYTYETNIMGTVNLLECVRTAQEPARSVLVITTDKVYQNREWVWGYREDDSLGGRDPYANSKSCAELVVQSYKNSFFMDGKTAISTARAGNVIGGGDFAKDRIIPDCVRGVQKQTPVMIRNPNSIRPYQHVLEPVMAYLMLAQLQYEHLQFSGCYNVGPEPCDCISTGNLAELFCQIWGEGAGWNTYLDHGPREDNYLRLDCSKLKLGCQWQPRWHIREAVEKTIEWSRVWLADGDVLNVMRKQIAEYLGV